MPLSADLAVPRLAERIQLLRKNPFATYGIAIAAVAVATAIRWSIGDYVLGRIPFTLYSLAIVLATLLAGFWPGMLATVLSVVAAWFFLISPEFSPYSQGEVDICYAKTSKCYTSKCYTTLNSRPHRLQGVA